MGMGMGMGMTSVNQTRPHCVNQMGKTHSKLVAARHAMYELALSLRSLCLLLHALMTVSVSKLKDLLW